MAYNPAMDMFLEEDAGAVHNQPNAPAMTEEEVRRARADAAARAEAERLRGVPLASQASVDAGGGTSVYQITDENLGTHRDPDSQSTVQRIGGPAATGGTTGRGALDTLLDDTARRSDEGATDRKNALQSVVDRFESAQDSFSTEQQDQSRLVQQQAQRQSAQVFDQAMGFDRDAAAARYSDEALSNALAIARSGPGGAARSSALFNALESVPAIQAEAGRQANAEARSQQNLALGATQALGNLATQTRSQDESQAEAYTGIGLDVAKNIANFTGQNLELDQRDREFLGEVALQVASLDLDWEKLGVDESLRKLELELAKQGMEQEWKIFKESQKITGKDILGGIFGLGGSAISGWSAGKAAGR